MLPEELLYLLRFGEQIRNDAMASGDAVPEEEMADFDREESHQLLEQWELIRAMPQKLSDRQRLLKAIAACSGPPASQGNQCGR